MKNFNKKLSAVVLSTLFATMQISTAAPIDTGLGAGNGGAVINSYTGGLQNVVTGTNTADLNFNGNSCVNWDTLNVNKNETLNFNAVGGADGLKILNTVNTGMSKIYGQINANNGISQLIISNPNGMIYDGARFTAGGDVILTTKNMAGLTVDNISDAAYTKLFKENGTSLIPIEIINDSNFNIGGNFTIMAPYINAAASKINTNNNTLKLVTANGQDYIDLGLAANTPGNNKGVTMLKAMTIDGNVVIVNDVGAMNIADGGTINGNLDVKTAGNTYLNSDSAHPEKFFTSTKKLVINGNAKVESSGVQTFVRNTDVNGNLDVKSDGGFVDVGNIYVKGNANLTTTGERDSAKKYQHFIHVIGNSTVDGDLNINSSKNIHIGGYDYDAHKLADGKLTVKGDLNAHSTGGHITTTIDTSANKISMKSDTHNILTDDKATLTAKEYEFVSNGYIGGITTYDDGNGTTLTPGDQIVLLMEKYTFIPADIQSHTYMNIGGGKVTKIETPQLSPEGNPVKVYIGSKGNMEITGANVNDLNITAYDKRIDITGPDVHAKNINVGNETDTLKVDFPSRDYTLNYTNIRDEKVVTVKPNDVITYELTNEPTNGYNSPKTGTRANDTTFLIGPDAPTPVTPPDIPTNSDNVRQVTWVPEDVTTAPVNTPIAFAADLDEDEETSPVRKNVDGSVTVVRAFPMMN